MLRTASPRVTRVNLVIVGVVPTLAFLPGVALLTAGPPGLAPPPFGGTGTAVMALTVLLVALAGVALAWPPRMPPARIRRLGIAALWLAAALLLIPIPGLLRPGHPILMTLLIPAAVSISLTADALRRTPPAADHP